MRRHDAGAVFGRPDKAADLIGASRRFLVSQTRHPSGDDRRDSLDLPALLEHLRSAGR
jgi:hypothetical protein